MPDKIPWIVLLTPSFGIAEVDEAAVMLAIVIAHAPSETIARTRNPAGLR